MRWNWQQPEWPDFKWETAKLVRAESLFAENAGVSIGATRHLDEDQRETLAIELMSDEACDTSAIEGEHLDRDSVQSSIRRQLGLTANRRAGPAEAGVAELMVDLYRQPTAALDHATLFSWHRMLMNGRRDIETIGGYRIHAAPMQIVSGPVHRPLVHFEAPPSEAIRSEMDRFLAWFQQTTPGHKQPLPAVTRAGIAHLWFESLHPFEDGNGRLGRAIVEKALAQGLSRPALTAVARTLLRRRKEYYRALELASRKLEITDWLLWFAAAVVEAQRRTLAEIRLTLHKARLFSELGTQLNPRQEKAVLRMFAEGPDGFAGGLSAGNYRRITGAPPATATRDLADLVALGALTKTGERKATRYYLNVPAERVERLKSEDLD